MAHNKDVNDLDTFNFDPKSKNSPRRKSDDNDVSPDTSGSITPASLEDGRGPTSTPPLNIDDACSTMEENFAWPQSWKAWTTLLGCFFLMFNSWGLVNAYGTFQSYYLQNLLPGKDLLYLNLVGSTESFMVLALSFVVGRFLDAGYYRYLTGVGAVLVTISMFVLSIVNGDGSYGSGDYGLIWLVQGFLLGLGMSCFFVASSQGKPALSD